MNHLKEETDLNDPKMNQYFRVLFQILKFICLQHYNSPNTSAKDLVDVLESTKPTPEEKFYANIVRAFIQDKLYYCLAVNSFAKEKSNSYYSYRLIIERYNFLEHMPYSTDAKTGEKLIFKSAIISYDISAFGNSDFIDTAKQDTELAKFKQKEGSQEIF